MAPSHEATTPGPTESSASASLEPPPAARQNTSEMHDREVNPPAGGNEGTGRDQPMAETTGVGTVVGTADGMVLVVVGELVAVVGVAVVGAADIGVVGVTWRTLVVAVDAQAETAAASSAVRIGAIGPARRRPGVTTPPSRSDPRTDRQG